MSEFILFAYTASRFNGPQIHRVSCSTVTFLPTNHLRFLCVSSPPACQRLHAAFKITVQVFFFSLRLKYIGEERRWCFLFLSSYASIPDITVCPNQNGDAAEVPVTISLTHATASSIISCTATAALLYNGMFFCFFSFKANLSSGCCERNTTPVMIQSRSIQCAANVKFLLFCLA